MASGLHDLSDEDIRDVRRVWDDITAANSSGDWDTTVQHLTADHASLDPRTDGILRGPRAWREFVDTWDLQDIDAGFTIEEIMGSGDLACVLWTFSGEWTERGEPVKTAGKGMSLFERDHDGAWKWSRNAWTTDPQ